MAKVISRTIASEVADKMTKKIQDKIKRKGFELEEFFVKSYYDNMDKELYNKLRSIPSKYLIKQTYVYISYNKANIVLSLQTTDIISPFNHIEMNEDVCKKIHHMKSEIEIIKLKKSEIKNRIIETLIGLRTYKRVKESFPDAYQYLPDETIGTNLPNVVDQVGVINKEINSICNG